jgi:hypothetical protein
VNTYHPKDFHSGDWMSNEIHLHIWKPMTFLKKIPYLCERLYLTFYSVLFGLVCIIEIETLAHNLGGVTKYQPWLPIVVA